MPVPQRAQEDQAQAENMKLLKYIWHLSQDICVITGQMIKLIYALLTERNNDES